jgi:hypothetical protein
MLVLLVAQALAAPFQSAGATVELPWNDFERLYAAYAREVHADPAPRAWTLDRAVFAGTIEGEGDAAFARIRLQVKGEVHESKGWTTVPLLGAATALVSAKIGGKDAALFVQDGFYTLVTDKPGPFEAQLELVVKLFAADGETGFTLPLPAAGATVVGLSVVSKEALAFDVPGAQGTSVTSVGDERRLEAFVPTMPSLTVSWHRAIPKEDETKQEPRVYAETRTLVGVSEGVLGCRADIDYTVLHARRDHFTVHLPTDATVLDVRGSGIRAWDQGPNGDITVQLNYGAEGLFRLGVDYERPLATTGATDVPLVRLAEVTRETDYIGVDARSAVEITAGAPVGAVAIDVRELPAAITGQTDYPVLLGYRARGGDVTLPLTVTQHPDKDMLVTLVDTGTAETVVTEDGRRLTRLRYGVRNNRRQFLRMTLPPGAEVWSAAVAGRGVRVATDTDGKALIPLVRSDASGGALTAFEVELVYVERGEALATGRGTLHLALPTVDVPSTLMQWSLYLPHSTTLVRRTATGTMRRVDWFSAAPVLPAEAVVTQAAQAAVRAEAAKQGESGTLGQGVEPVEVMLPLQGNTSYFERMLVLEEPLWAEFRYRRRGTP